MLCAVCIGVLYKGELREAGVCCMYCVYWCAVQAWTDRGWCVVQGWTDRGWGVLCAVQGWTNRVVCVVCCTRVD